MICGKCGRSIPKGALFCCWCGVRCGEKVCAACGAKLRSDQLFCHECGLKCEGDISQTVEQPYGRAPLQVEYNTVSGSNKEKTDGNMHKLTVIRKLRAGNDEMIFEVYINDRSFGNIEAGEAIYADIFSEKVIVDIKYAYRLYAGELVPKVWKNLVLADLKNPKISFGVSEYSVFREGNKTYPTIETFVSGATVLRQEQKML